MNTINTDLVAISVLSGFVGDILLQTGGPHFGGPSGWGLKPYFQQHGPVEATVIAAGLMGLLYILYVYILKIPLTYTGLALFGIGMDFIFREMRIFPSLDGYHDYMSRFMSATIGGAIPMMIPFLIYRNIR